MSTSPRLPLLAPPRPSFPAQFHTSDRVSEASSSTTAWPEDAEAQHAESSSVAASSGEVIWQIKTDREVHLDRLGEDAPQGRTSLLELRLTRRPFLQRLACNSFEPIRLPIFHPRTMPSSYQTATLMTPKEQVLGPGTNMNRWTRWVTKKDGRSCPTLPRPPPTDSPTRHRRLLRAIRERPSYVSLRSLQLARNGHLVLLLDLSPLE